MCVDEIDGCGRVSPAPVFVCEEGTKKMENKSMGLHCTNHSKEPLKARIVSAMASFFWLFKTKES